MNQAFVRLANLRAAPAMRMGTTETDTGPQQLLAHPHCTPTRTHAHLTSRTHAHLTDIEAGLPLGSFAPSGDNPCEASAPSCRALLAPTAEEPAAGRGKRSLSSGRPRRLARLLTTHPAPLKRSGLWSAFEAWPSSTSAVRHGRRPHCDGAQAHMLIQRNASIEPSASIAH